MECATILDVVLSGYDRKVRMDLERPHD